MLSEIYNYKKNIPWQSLSIIACSVAVTTSTQFFTNLENVFGSFNKQTSIPQLFTLSFQHGFDTLSAVLHLLVNLILMAYLAVMTEKIAGSWRFFLLNVIAIITYGLFHKLLSMTGHGLTGLLWAYTPVIFYTLNEVRLLKTRSIFDDLYRSLKNILMAMFTVFPVLFAIIPIHFESELPLYKAVIEGNVFIFTATLTGFLFMLLFKEQIRKRLKSFAKKKKFDDEYADKFEIYYALFYPLLVFTGFILSR
jgi:membrane associated rhomboid family serine protease